MDSLQLPESLYLQYMPDPTGLKTLIGLQQSAMQLHDAGRSRAVPARQMHLTVLHFGYVTETFTQLHAVNPYLTIQEYNQATLRLIQKARTILPETVSVQPAKLELYGLHKNVLALSCGASPALHAVQEQILEATRHYLQDLDIGNPRDIPHRPRALQIPEAFNPHITIVKGYGGPVFLPPHSLLNDNLILHRYEL